MEKSKSYSYSHWSELDNKFSQSNSYTFNGPNYKEDDPEVKRKKRVAIYNGFTTEGKLKDSVRSSFKWIKTKLTDFRYGV